VNDLKPRYEKEYRKNQGKRGGEHNVPTQGLRLDEEKEVRDENSSYNGGALRQGLDSSPLDLDPRAKRAVPSRSMDRSL